MPPGCNGRPGTHELGGTVVVMEKFDAEEFLALVEREDVTHTQVVPTMLVRLMKLAPEVRASTTTRVSSASSTPPPPALSRSSTR